MRILATTIAGAYEIHMVPQADDRGFFARSWCAREFAEAGLSAPFVQASVSYNTRSGTLRGLHFQRAPSPEDKLVRCTAGAIYDVLLDLRPRSETYLKWITRELTADNHVSLYVPAGVAHGFQTLTDDTEVLYQMTDFFAPDLASGVAYDDPAFRISWPLPISMISHGDRGWARFVASPDAD